MIYYGPTVTEDFIICIHFYALQTGHLTFLNKQTGNKYSVLRGQQQLNEITNNNNGTIGIETTSDVCCFK